MRTIEFDGIIIGGGGAGMRASLQLSQSGYKTAVISKFFLLGRIQYLLKAVLLVLSLVADPQDDWRWHMYDTVKGADYIGDQDAIEYMCSEGPKTVFELEYMGLPFSRFENGRIYQDHLVDSLKNLAKAGKQRELVRQKTGLDTHYCIRYFKIIFATTLLF